MSDKAGNCCVSLFTIIFVVCFLLISTGNARADTNLNCDAYAQAAIDQQAQNMKLKCGYKGKAWQLSYANHKNWCLSNGVGIMNVSNENHNRKQALKKCAAKKVIFIPLKIKNCDKYAQDAINQQVANMALKCGKSGKGWSTNFLAHKNWCASKSVTVAMINNETKRRGSSLGKCLFKK
jgi:hypothetical protein